MGKAKKVSECIKTRQPAPVVPIHKHIEAEDDRWDHACDVAWLMSNAGKGHAITLQLENLINTYGYSSVIGVLYNLRGEK